MVKQPIHKSNQHPELKPNDGLAFYITGQYFESDCVGNNSMIKTMHIGHEACDQIFQALSTVG